MVDKQKRMEIKRSDKFSLFLPAFIDDYGLTPEEFRVFSRICRRAYGDSDCFESIPNLAKALMMSEILVRRALKVLEGCRAISRTSRPGKSDVFDFNSTEKWKPKTELLKIRTSIEAEPKEKDRARKSVKKPLVVMETTGVSGYGNDTTPLMETTGVVVMETTDEGIPIEGNPSKVSGGGKKNYGTPFGSLSKLPANADAQSALESWLDRVAQSLGVSSRYALADFEKWENVCIKAIDDGRELSALIQTVENELARCQETPQFFSPNNILKQLQVASALKSQSVKAAPAIDPDLERELNRKARIEKEGITDENRIFYDETLANIRRIQNGGAAQYAN